MAPNPPTGETATDRPGRPKKGALLDLRIESLAYGGRGVARANGYVVFVPNTAPGDRVKARLRKRKSSYGEASLLEVVEPAAERIQPVCPIASECGGCTWQHLPTDVQEQWKDRIVRDALRAIAGEHLADVQVDPLVESPEPFHYRNKMEFTFGREKGGGPLKLGFHRPANWRQILNVERCWLHPKPFDRVLEAARHEGERQKLTAWSPFTHTGTLRHLIVRWSVHEQRGLVALLTGDQKDIDFHAFRQEITGLCPEIKGVVWGLNAGRSDVARAERILETWGEDTLEERIGDLRFRVSLASFFQTNTRGAGKLYSVTRDYLDLTGRENLFDAYCGTGSIGLSCADGARHVYGIDVVPEAIQDARENAALNGLGNTTFLAGDMAQALPILEGAIPGRIDRLVVDPPRSGMEKKALAKLIGLRAPVVVYVSCNPTTMARDFQQLMEAGYRLEKLRPVDMFPQTYHIECVARCVLDN